jgi:hypothetical protein
MLQANEDAMSNSHTNDIMACRIPVNSPDRAHTNSSVLSALEDSYETQGDTGGDAMNVRVSPEFDPCFAVNRTINICCAEQFERQHDTTKPSARVAFTRRSRAHD